MAGMSKRHFEGLAKIIAANGTRNTKDPQTALLLVAMDIAAMCANENPQFDRARFMAACGFPNGEA